MSVPQTQIADRRTTTNNLLLPEQKLVLPSSLERPGSQSATAGHVTRLASGLLVAAFFFAPDCESAQAQQLPSRKHDSLPVLQAATPLPIGSALTQPTLISPTPKITPAPLNLVDPIPEPNLLETDDLQPGGIDPVYSLEQLKSMAVSSSPTIQSAIMEIERIQGIRCQSGLKPNPTLGYFGSQLADQGTDQHGLFLERQFVRGNKLELNRNVLDQSVMVAQNQLTVVQQKVMTDIEKLYYQTAAAQLKANLISQFVAVAERGVEIAQKRVEAKEASQIELLQAKTLKIEVEMSIKQVQAVYNGCRAQLAALVGIPVDTAFTVQDQLPEFEAGIDWDSRLQQIKASSPALALANAELCEAEAFLRRQQVQATPNITAQLGAGIDNGTNSGMINLQFSAPIPVRNRNQGNIAAARAAYQKAAAEVQRVETQLSTSLSKLAADYQAQLAVVQNLDQGILPQIRQTLELSEQAYVAGELDFLQVAVIRKSLYESQVRWIDARLELSQSAARLDGLLLEGALDAPQQVGIGDGLRDLSLTGE